jgi:hypothetical protein
MSETICPCCGASSPDDAMYCMLCGEPIKCKGCGAGILANARACIRCGKLVPERDGSAQRLAGAGLVPPGYNRLAVHEKNDSYSYDADFVFSDVFGQQTGASQVISQLGGFGERASPSRPIPQRTSRTPSVVEFTEQPAVPQLAPGPDSAAPFSTEATASKSSTMSAEERAIRTVYAEHDGKLTLQLSDLKAASQTDYTLRLAHMFIFARQILFGEQSTLRAEVYDVAGFANLPHDNVAAYLSRDSAIAKAGSGDALSLNLSGLEHARKCLMEIIDPAVPPGKWTPSAEARVAPRTRKAGKRGDAQLDDDQMAAIKDHPETQTLVTDIPHERIAELSVLDKTIVALYGLKKAGREEEVYYGVIAQYLYSVFHVKVHVDAIRSSLRTAMSNHSIYVVHKEKEGYRITPSGENHVEALRRQSGRIEVEHAELPSEQTEAESA